MTHEDHAGVHHPHSIKGIDTLKARCRTAPVQAQPENRFRLENDDLEADAESLRLARDVLLGSSEPARQPLVAGYETPDGQIAIDGLSHQEWLVADPDAVVARGDAR